MYFERKSKTHKLAEDGYVCRFVLTKSQGLKELYPILKELADCNSIKVVHTGKLSNVHFTTLLA